MLREEVQDGFVEQVGRALVHVLEIDTVHMNMRHESIIQLEVSLARSASRRA
jgi:hypothetical protein